MQDFVDDLLGEPEGEREEFPQDPVADPSGDPAPVQDQPPRDSVDHLPPEELEPGQDEDLQNFVDDLLKTLDE